MSWAFILAIIFLFIVIITVMFIILYYLFWKPSNTSVSTISCESNNSCPVNQVCQSGFCAEIICNSDSDCNGNGICINSYCTLYSCQNGNDCPDNTACLNGSCIRTGDSCQSNINCSGLSCMNQVCAQCLSNSNCPIGQGCFNQMCRYPYTGETGANVINYSSPAQTNGNVGAPPGYFCSGTNCGTGSAGQEQISCSNTGSVCPNSCPFCINSVCRCTQGQNLEPCRNNSDCISSVCKDTQLGKVCVPIGGECIYNYNGTGGDNICPVSRPYCVNGSCSPVSLGAVCGTTGLPPDLCNNPQSLGVPGQTGINQNGMGFFCVNGTCQQTPGSLNDLCTPGSCGFINNGIFTCQNINNTNFPEMRCLRS